MPYSTGDFGQTHNPHGSAVISKLDMIRPNYVSQKMSQFTEAAKT